MSIQELSFCTPALSNKFLVVQGGTDREKILFHKSFKKELEKYLGKSTYLR